MINVIQNTIGSLRKASSTPSFVGLLDTYSGAAVGYSLRRLRTAYSGNCIKVRRSVGGATTYQDIGFVNNILDTASLLTFIGVGNDGFIDTWYDQSGNGRNMAYTETISRQPRIVLNGSMEFINSKPAIKAVNATSGLYSPYDPDGGVSGKQIFMVAQRTSVTDRMMLLGTYLNGGDYYMYGRSGNTITKNSNNVAVTSLRKDGATFAPANIGAVYTAFANQSIISSNSVFSSVGVQLAIGYTVKNNSLFPMYDTQELVIFENQTNQAAKEMAINSFYNAY